MGDTPKEPPKKPAAGNGEPQSEGWQRGMRREEIAHCLGAGDGPLTRDKLEEIEKAQQRWRGLSLGL